MPDIEEGGEGGAGIIKSASSESFNKFLHALKNPIPPLDGPPKKVGVNGRRSSFDTAETSILDPYKQADSTVSEKDDIKDSHGHQDQHGHHGPNAISLVASAVVCFVIYFVFCIVFSSVVWDPLNVALDETVDPPFGIPQGVGINLLGIAVGSLFFSRLSGCRAIVGGSDLLPVVFFAEAGACVWTYVAGQAAAALEAECAAAAAHRLLGGEDSFGDSAGGYDGHGDAYDDPCAGGDVYHRILAGGGGGLAPEFMAKIAPTTLVAMMIGNVVTALTFYTLGKMKNTASVIGFIPASVVAGFLTCIGYKVIKLAYLITTGYSFKEKYIRKISTDLPHSNDPWVPLLIAIIYGCSLYGFKRAHYVASEKLILGYILVPIAVFFVVVKVQGTSMQTLREQDWFLTQARDGDGCYEDCGFRTTNFWQTWQVVTGPVEWRAIPSCILIFIMGAVMTSLDNMLKLTSSEKALGVDLDYNHEMRVGGKATLFSALLCGSPAYGQTKFNVINYSIAGTAESPLPTIYLGVICLAVFLSGVAGPIINIMPRFLLGGLCVFAGFGFLYENLYEGRKNMNRVSFAIVWIIFLTNFVWEFFILQELPPNIQPMVPGLLIVFILGIVLSTFEFMFAFMHKTKPPVIRRGDECCSSAVRSEKLDTQLAVMSPWFQVFSVESFIFFGTANNLYQQLKSHLADQKTTKPKAEQTKYLVFDLTGVTGIDSSAMDVFFKVCRLLKAEGIDLVWAMKHQKTRKKFEDWGLFDGTTHCDTLDLALRHVEDAMLRRASRLSEKWLANPIVRKIFERQVLANVFNISVRPEEKTLSIARLSHWAARMEISAGDELCGDGDDSLYMLYSGEVQVQGRDGNDYSVFTGSFFNLDRLLISTGALRGVPMTLGVRATKNSMVLVLTREKYLEMQREDGALSQKLLTSLIVQNESNRPGRLRPISRVRVGLMGQLDLSVNGTIEKSMMNLSMLSGDIDPLAKRILGGNDYQIKLTKAQEESFKRIFDFIDENDAKDIPMDEFAKYVIIQARSLGSQIHHKQFMDMIQASGVDKDGDGVLSINEFLAFLQGLFLSNIPSKELPFLRQAYDNAVAEAPDKPMDTNRVQILFGSLGFDVENAGWQDVVGVIDADGNGDVDFEEFLTGVGMMKKLMILSAKLDTAFRCYKEQSMAKRRSSLQSQDSRSLEPSTNAVPLVNALRNSLLRASTGSPASQGVLDDYEKSDSWSNSNLELDALDLEMFLDIPRDMAEEMVFLADQDDVPTDENDHGSSTDASVIGRRTIDRDEFQQLIQSWS